MLAEAGVDIITIMDSAGTMYPHETTAYVKALKEKAGIPVGSTATAIWVFRRPMRWQRRKPVRTKWMAACWVWLAAQATVLRSWLWPHFPIRDCWMA